MFSHWKYKHFTPIYKNFSTKEHPPSGNWPSWQCCLLVWIFSSAYFFLLFNPQVLQGDFSYFENDWIFNLVCIFCFLGVGAITAYLSLDLYAFVLRDKPEQPWLWAIFSMAYWYLLCLPFVLLAFLSR